MHLAVDVERRCHSKRNRKSYPNLHRMALDSSYLSIPGRFPSQSQNHCAMCAATSLLSGGYFRKAANFYVSLETAYLLLQPVPWLLAPLWFGDIRGTRKSDQVFQEEDEVSKSSTCLTSYSHGILTRHQRQVVPVDRLPAQCRISDPRCYSYYTLTTCDARWAWLDK